MSGESSSGGRRAFGLGRAIAYRDRHDYTGTEHLALGILESEGSAAVAALREVDAEPAFLRRAISSRMRVGRRPSPRGQLPITPQVKRVLEVALEESTRFGHDTVGTAHLLLGLVADRSGPLAPTLRLLESRSRLIHAGRILASRRRLLVLCTPEETRGAARVDGSTMIPMDDNRPAALASALRAR